MSKLLRRILKFLSSLELTIACLSLAMVLVFWSTLAQKNLDAFYAQKQFFYTCFVWVMPKGMHHAIPVFPGGYLLGTVFLVNLVAAHTVRFKFSSKKSGIILTHLGLILLLSGGLFTALWSDDTRMTVEEGGSTNFAESLMKEYELAVIDKSDPAHDTVVAIPASWLQKQKTVENGALPFLVKPLQYFPNAQMTMRPPGAHAQLANKGMGERLDVVPLPETNRPDQENAPAAFVELDGKSGPLGTWLLWAPPLGSGVPMPAQTLSVDGKTYELQLRLKRYYKPFQIHLEKLTHEIYAGTDIPKNFASRIRLDDPQAKENREVLIYMNHPLRYRGETFYQYQTLDAEGTFSIFEVVQNPSWWLPYVSCSMVAAGLIIQFVMHLVNFIHRRRA